MTKYRVHPELVAGIRVQYYDRDEKTRAGTIVRRSGNILTVMDFLRQKEKVHLEKIIGYWKPKARAKPINMIKLER